MVKRTACSACIDGALGMCDDHPAHWHPIHREMIPAWMPSPVVSGGFLEGNVVLRPDGRVSLLMRCRVYNGLSKMYSVQEACLFNLVESPSNVRFNNTQLSLSWQGHVFMPGGGNKFTVRCAAGLVLPEDALQFKGPLHRDENRETVPVVTPARRYDTCSQLYLSLTNPSIDRYGVNPDARNVLVLAFSPNLVDWRIATTVLVPNDGLDWEASLWFTGYQYVDWQTDGPDLVMAVRTAYQGAHSFHDSNRRVAWSWVAVQVAAGILKGVLTVQLCSSTLHAEWRSSGCTTTCATSLCRQQKRTELGPPRSRGRPVVQTPCCPGNCEYRQAL